ncbi:TPA: vesicle-associated membrane protein 7-like [Bos taurus]|nr:TPA: vesicle-associated membrane protein 7-like [Bos taurus]
MAILFAVVARGTTILAKHAWCGGNFLEVTEQILAKIPSENNKLTYSHGNYLFHYICQDRIVYLCITDDDFERSRAFNFLNEIKKRFQTTYGSRAQTALPYAMNSEFSSVLAAQLGQVDGQDGEVGNPELTSFHGHTKITTIYGAAIDEEDQKTSRKDLILLKI